ncbi:MAG: hypothetical protein KDE34_27385 [Anaerolineales bacterium]|nr:hypothetical protein [Anaerolineales bacterium]MCB8963096.1 hypothetical protein [Ardenticatenales bacterium]
MESATDRPDIQALQQEVEFARRYQKFIRDNASYHNHIVINPLTYVNGYAEIFEQVANTGEGGSSAQLLDFAQGLKYGAVRAMDAFYQVMKTIQLPLSEPDNPEAFEPVALAEEANSPDATVEPPFKPTGFPEQLAVLNTILLHLFHSWGLDPAQQVLIITKGDQRNELRLTSQLLETKAVEAEAKKKIEPAALALAKIGGALEVEKTEGNEATIKLTLPDYFTN